MTDINDMSECATCGALVTDRSKHRIWHEALSQVLPALAAELNNPQRHRSLGVPPNLELREDRVTATAKTRAVAITKAHADAVINLPVTFSRPNQRRPGDAEGRSSSWS
jgi:hypothetical protein